jgi:hypothetical protein
MAWAYPPPYPMPPRVRVWLTPGAGGAFTEITNYLSQETAPVLTTTIENPTSTNQFTAADITLKGYDPDGTIKGLFANILPSSTDYVITINLGIPGTNGGALDYANDLIFDGFVTPATLQFNTKDKSFSFTVVSSIRRLQTTSATSLFQRAGYSDLKWTLYQDASPLDTMIAVAGGSFYGGSTVCDFLPGDVVKVASGDARTVVSVNPDPANSPPLFWLLTLSENVDKKYPTTSSVVLMTPYQRNLSLESMVTTLYSQAGFNSKAYFAIAPLPNSFSLMLASPVNNAGLPGGPVTGIAPGIVAQGVQAPVMASTANGLYIAPDPLSPFVFSNSSATKGVIDDTNINSGVVFQNAPKRTMSRANNPRYGLNVTFKFYAYDGFFYGATTNRYVLTVNCNADVDGLVFSFSSKLSWEKQTAGTLAWVAQGDLQILASGTTTNDLGMLYDAIGIEVDSATGTCFFTDILNSAGAGTAITMNTSAWQPTGATIATGTYQSNKATGINGPIVLLRKAGGGLPTVMGVFQVDGTLGVPAHVVLYNVVANGTMTMGGDQPISPYIIPRSVKWNHGDGRYYGLISDPTQGILLISWPTNQLYTDASSGPQKILPAPPKDAQTSYLGQTPYEVDLIVLQNTNAWGVVGPFPFVANVGGSLYYIATTYSGIVPYADMTDLSVADALQQLSILDAGIFYVAPTGWYFRSRSAPMPGNTIGSNPQIDGDPGILSLVQQSTFNRWVGYVRVENENDDTIFGEAGDHSFAETDQGLTLKSRFVFSSVFAGALATSLFNYLGNQKRWIEIERTRDGRTYECGRTFYATVDGLSRQFQIIETGHPVTGVTVKVVGLEV